LVAGLLPNREGSREGTELSEDGQAT
jgi:hypothetical protein